MTDEDFKRLCQAQGFLVSIPFRAGAATEGFWDDAERSARALGAMIEAECPGYFAVRDAAWAQLKAMRKDGMSSEEVTAACEKITSQCGHRTFVWG